MSLPLVFYERPDSVKFSMRQSQLCVLCNVDVSKICKMSLEDRILVYGAIVDIVHGVWDQVTARKDENPLALFTDLNFATRPCGVGLTGLYTAACILGEEYNLEFALKWFNEFIRECTKFFNAKPHKSSHMFSIPPSSNAEKNMLSSANVLAWHSNPIIFITDDDNIKLKYNPVTSTLSYNDMIILQSKVDQAMSLNSLLTDRGAIEQMMKYMVVGGLEYEGKMIRVPTISYYGFSDIERSCSGCDV